MIAKTLYEILGVEVDATDIKIKRAYRKLVTSGSHEFRIALMRAEAEAGRQVDARQVAAGVHLHGDTWHKGH